MSTKRLGDSTNGYFHPIAQFQRFTYGKEGYEPESLVKGVEMMAFTAKNPAKEDCHQRGLNIFVSHTNGSEKHGSYFMGSWKTFEKYKKLALYSQHYVENNTPKVQFVFNFLPSTQAEDKFSNVSHTKLGNLY